ncbi:MAG: ankyrin repeat domain-containing protein [Bosea sp. (in: a-proteobacteria)]|nr:ankyrin repeat domain-containing protein [Bosea sp. (in: a-proteobacteria)]
MSGLTGSSAGVSSVHGKPAASKAGTRRVTDPHDLLARCFAAMLALGFVLVLANVPTSAQTPPSAAEIAAYDGLHAAAWMGDVAAIERLVAAGAAVDIRDGRSRTALHIAAHARQREAMRTLVRLGADPRALDAQRYDTVTIAAVADDAETMRVALAIGADPRAITSPYDGTALIAAAHLGHDENVRMLIEAGAALDHVNNLAWTALIEAIILGDGGARHERTVSHLVAAGARRDIGDRNGVMPIEMARQRGYGAMVRILESR